MQLGITSILRDVPRLLPRNGGLGQQWRIRSDSAGQWILSNALLGAGSVLGVSEGGNRKGFTSKVPAINPSPDGTEHWIVTINVSAGEITALDALSEVAGLEVRLSTPSSRLIERGIGEREDD